MKILIVSGIYPPEIGGPATYAQKLAEKLKEIGHKVAVVTFSNEAEASRGDALNLSIKYQVSSIKQVSNIKYQSINTGDRLKIIRIVRGNRILNRIRFFVAAYKIAKEFEVIYTLDWFAAGLPLAFAAKLRRKHYIVRVGGDYLWEQRYLERGEGPISLENFYASGIYKRKRYSIFYSVIRYVLQNAAHVIFNSDRQRELYVRYYGLSSSRVSTIYNPVPSLELKKIPTAKTSKEFIYWGRFIVMKNLTTLIRAFASAKLPSSYTLTLIGEGPRKKELGQLVRNLGVSERVKILPSMSLSQVLERGRSARAFILPSWTDISPNQVYECLAIGLPVLVTKENYLSLKGELPEMIDPNSEADIAAKLERLADDRYYADFARRFNAISVRHDWSDVAREHINVFEKIAAPISEARVLQIGSDRTIFESNSPSAFRMKEYGKCFRNLDMIIFTLRRNGFRSVDLAPNVRALPTNSFSKLFYVFGAIYLALKLPRPGTVSTQDPFEAGLAGLVISAVRRIPLHVQIHTDFLSEEFAKLSLLNRIRLLLARIVLPRADRIRVVSNRVKESVTKKYPLKTEPSVLPIFVDIKRFKAEKANPALLARDHLFDYRFLVVSRLEQEKNIELAIDAFARAAIEKSCLIIIGDGSQLGALHEFAEKKGVGKWVFFEGYTDPAPYYKIADLVLFPSLYDGYGMVIVEALAAGTPVLSTDVGVAKEAGAIVASREDLSEALKNWVKNGPREGNLQNYAYKNFGEYVEAYCADLSSCASEK